MIAALVDVGVLVALKELLSMAFVLNQLILWVGVKFTSVYYLVVKIFAMVIVPVCNFITRKLFLESR